MGKANEINRQRYDFFISYYSGTGSAFAKHLKDYAKDFRSNAFLDTEDIPKSIIKETDEWRSHIDHAIEDSTRFILILTLGFKERPEIKREYRKALDKRINVLLFKKEDLADEELIMKIGDETVDFSRYEYTSFSDKYDLLEKVRETLGGKRKPQKTSLFIIKAEELIAAEGLEIKQTNKPILEIVVGPSGNGEEWLPTIDHKNRELLSLNPYCDNYCNMKARRNFFECESWSKEKPLYFFLRVNADGFFHLVEPLHNDEQYWLDVIFGQVLDMLVYCIIVMKDKQLNTKQSVFICLRNVCGLDVRTAHFQRIGYSFPNSAPEPFLAEFDPASSWKEIGIVLKKIYRELCQEVSYEIAEEEINQRLQEMTKYNFYVRSSHDCRGLHCHIFLQAIKIDDFGFTDKNQKVE
jgi:hypothetical protein